MPACLQGHLARVGEERCAFVRAMVFANRAMQSRAALQREADNWLGEAGTLPPGNGAEAELWEGATAGAGGGASLDTSLMTPAELAEYEEKKLKMRKVGASCFCNVRVRGDCAVVTARREVAPALPCPSLPFHAVLMR
jgi:hypothetical protein